MRKQNIVITRGQIGQWGGCAGGAALLLGVLGFIWQGGLTIYILIALVAGVLGIGVWALMSPAEFVGFITGRQVRYGTTAVFSTLLLVGIVVMTYIMLQKAVLTLDMTEGYRFTLSQETREVLRRIKRPIRITGFYTPSELVNREVDDEFFRLYEVESGGLITRQYIDPLEQPALAEPFVQRFGVIADPYNVFVSYLNADGTVDFNTVTAVDRGQMQERDMTQAISRLLATGSFTVYFEISHGEYDPLDNTQQGLSIITNGIRQNIIGTLPLDLAELAKSGGSIPQDASAVIMARPKTAISEAEIALLDAYLKDGGALFIMSDVIFLDDPFLTEDSSFNRYLWDNFGIRALDAIVVDPAASGQTALDVISAAVYTDTDIGANLNIEGEPDSRVQFRIARALEVNDTPPVSNGRVIMSSPESYGETNLQALHNTDTYTYDEGQDIKGPLTLAAWAWDQNTDARVLLVGDGDFITNGQVGSPLGNRTLFMDGLAWMTGYAEQVRFAPQAFSTGLPFFADGATLDLIAFLTVIVMPGAVLLVGGVVWFRRIRR